MDPTPTLSLDSEPTVVLRHSGGTDSQATPGATPVTYDASRDGLDGVDLDEIEVLRGSYQRIKSFGLPLKIHLGLAVAISVICMLGTYFHEFLARIVLLWPISRAAACCNIDHRSSFFDKTANTACACIFVSVWHWQGAPICAVPLLPPIAAPALSPVAAPVAAPVEIAAPSGAPLAPPVAPPTAPPVAAPALPSPSAPSVLEVALPKFWWFFYPFLVFSFTIPAHHFFTEAKWDKIGITFGVVLNLTLFLTWAFRMPLGNTKDCTKNIDEEGHFMVGDTFTAPWPIFPAAATAIIAVFAHYMRQPKEQRKWFRLLLNEYWIINVSFFLIWLFYGQGHPWFLYPLFALALPVVLHRMRFVYKETRLWAYVAVVLIVINLLLFLAWIFTDTGFPCAY